MLYVSCCFPPDVVDVNAITDPLEKEACVAQINSFGQTPHQIFKKPHPARQPTPHTHRLTLATHPHLIHPFQNWPNLATQLTSKIQSLYWSPKSEKLFVLDSDKCIIPGSFTKYLSWGFSDLSLRFCILQTSPRHRILDEVVAIHENLHENSQITTASASEDGQLIFTGGTDGLVKIWRLHPQQKHHQLMLQKTLPAHWAPITHLVHAWSYSLLVTAGEDGQVLFYDLNRLVLQRRLPIHPSPITAIAINPHSGDVITCAGPNFYLWDLNGELVAEHLGSVSSSESIESVTFSQGPEGAWIDPVILTGHRDGAIRVWRIVYPNGAAAEAFNGNELPTASASAASSSASSSSSSSSASAAASTPSSTTTSNSTFTAPASTSTHAQSQSRRDSTTTAPGGMEGRPRTDSTLARPTTHTSTTTLPTKHHSGTSSSSSCSSQSLDVGFLSLALMNRLDPIHDCSVTVLHTSPSDWKRVWSGDSSGRVVSWQISSDDHWTSDAEAKNCSACQVKFSVLERRHRQEEQTNFNTNTNTNTKLHTSISNYTHMCSRIARTFFLSIFIFSPLSSFVVVGVCLFCS